MLSFFSNKLECPVCARQHFGRKDGCVQKGALSSRQKTLILSVQGRRVCWYTLKQGIIWAWRFTAEKNQKISGAHKIGAAISGLRIAGEKFYGHAFFAAHVMFMLEIMTHRQCGMLKSLRLMCMKERSDAFSSQVVHKTCLGVKH